LAQLGDFDRAAEVERRVIEIAKREELPEWLVKVLEGHLAEFQAGRAVRDP